MTPALRLPSPRATLVEVSWQPVDLHALQPLIGELALPAEYLQSVESALLPLAEWLAARAGQRDSALLVGLSGSQGSGKSTACRFLQELLWRGAGLRSVTLSIDDFYLTRTEREDLAKHVHPLLRTRGVPGTHDTRLAAEALRTLSHQQSQQCSRWPRFDKATDDRALPERWQQVQGRLDLVLFEGWCVGATAQPAAQLAHPLNPLEAGADPDGSFRRYVNARLGDDYRQLFELLERLVFFRAPSMQQVLGWRRQQEQSLRRAGASAAMSDEQLERFVQHYERITRHMLVSMPQRVDVWVPIDPQHRLGAPQFVAR